MSHALNPAAVQPDPALLCAVGEQLAQVLASNRHLARNPTINLHARRRIEVVIAGLIEALDRIDGDVDLEDGCDTEMVCEDEGAQCDDEGHQCSGIAQSN